MQKQIDVKYAQTLSVAHLLAYIVEIYGKDLYLRPQQLVGLLADLMNVDDIVKRFYRRAILDDRLAEKLYHVVEKHGNDHTHITLLTNTFARNNAYTYDFAEVIVSNFLKGIDLNNNESGIIENNKKRVLPDDNLKDKVQDICDTLLPIPVLINGRYGFILKNGTEIVSPRYNSASNFSEGLAAVKLNGKWGYINKEGKEIIPLNMIMLRPFLKGWRM